MSPYSSRLRDAADIKEHAVANVINHVERFLCTRRTLTEMQRSSFFAQHTPPRAFQSRGVTRSAQVNRLAVGTRSRLPCEKFVRAPQPKTENQEGPERSVDAVCVDTHAVVNCILRTPCI